MAEKRNFTKRYLESLQAGGRRQYFYDSKTPNLAICVTPAGKKTFYRCGRVHGRAVRYRIGEFGVLTVEQARNECIRLSHEIAKGNDPHLERIAARAETTLQEMFDWYLENHSKPHKSTWKRDVSNFEQSLSHWGTRRLAAIKTSEVQALHTEIGASRGHYAANKMLELLRHMYSKAETNGWYSGVSPTRGVKRFTTTPRERFLTPDEVEVFFKAVNNIKREATRDFIFMCLFTGARRSNVCSMRWSEVDLQNATWMIPGEQFKNGRPVAVVLPSPALQILERRNTGESEWVFPGQGSKGHFVEPKAGWQKALKEAGIENLRLHDLRRTLGSWQAAQGTSLQIIGKSLGHETLQATRIYARLQLDAVRDSVQSATDAIIALSKEKS